MARVLLWVFFHIHTALDFVFGNVRKNEYLKDYENLMSPTPDHRQRHFTCTLVLTL